jgi:hypothetical protein
MMAISKRALYLGGEEADLKILFVMSGKEEVRFP